MIKSILVGTVFLLGTFINAQAQRRGEYKDSFTQTLKNLQAIDARNKSLKTQKSPSLDKLILLTSSSFNEAESILSKDGWQYLSADPVDDKKGMVSDSSFNEVIFGYNLVNDKAWYTMSLSDKGNFSSFIFEEKGICNKLLNQLTLANFKFVSSTVNSDNGIIKSYVRVVDDRFIMASMFISNFSNNTSKSNTYRFVIILDKWYNKNLRPEILKELKKKYYSK